MDTKGKQDSVAGFGRFRISTMMSWTAIAAVAFASGGASDLVTIKQPSEAAFFTLALLILFAPACCIPFLVDQLLDAWQLRRESKPFSTSRKALLFLFVGLYSMGMFAISSDAFLADWKGSKGPAWFYYTLESAAALTWWPSYFAGGVAFIIATLNHKLATGSPVIFLMMVIQTIISCCYTFACGFMNFAPAPELWTGTCAVCYGLFTAIIFRQRSWSFESVKES